MSAPKGFDATGIDFGDDLPRGVWLNLTGFVRITEVDGVTSVTVRREITEIPTPSLPLHGEDE